MTGSDDGGFKPHPGDPWHPGWTDDAEHEDEEQSAVAGEQDEAPILDDTGKKKRKSRRRLRRRDVSADEPDPAFDPTSTAFDHADEAPGEGAESVDEDPFGTVLEREGRRRRAGADDVPPPAWTVDEAPGDDPLLPVEQPSWVGQTTAGGSGVEAVGFEATVESDAATDAVEVPRDAPDPAESPKPVEPAESPVEVIGTYGVAGPEAFDALATDDTGELDEWEAYAADPAADPGAAAVDEIADAMAGDTVAASEELQPRSRRGLFKRRKGRRESEPDVAESLEPVADELPEPDVDDSAIPPQPQFSPPTEPLAGDEVFGEWIEADRQPRRGLFRRKRRDPDPIDEEAAFEVESADVDEWLAVEAQATEAAIRLPDGLEVDELPEPADDSTGLEAPVGDLQDLDVGETEDLSEVVAEVLQSLDDGDIAAEQAAPDEDAAPTLEPPAVLDHVSADDDVQPSDDQVTSPDGPRVAAELVADDEVEAQDEWLGDASGIPDEWFAEVDEDAVVPPPVADTPETEWAESAAEPGVEPGTTGPLFDIEAPEQPPQFEPVPTPVPQVPEGYEPWDAAVEEAVEAAAGAQPADDGTYEYEQPLLQDPRHRTDDLPAGFEPFPGEMERFELSEESLRSEMAPSAFEDGWVTDDVDPGSTGELPYGVSEEIIIDEDIYAGGSTIEHRDLAAAIAEAGVENTQWQAISAAMPGLETGVVGFADVADLGSGGDYVAPRRSNLGVRVATGLVLVGLLFGSLVLADAAFAVFVALMVILGLGEFYSALRRAGYLPLSLFGLVGGAATLATVWFHGPLAIPAGILLTSTATFFFYAFSPTRRDALANGGLTVLGVGWIVGSVAFAIPIARTPDRVVLVFAIVAITAAADIGAFFFGKAWGKSPLAPVLSPNKTVEGLLGGITLGLAAAGAIGFFELGPFDLKAALGLGAIVSVLAPLGDLSESLVKRSVGIKDMGGTLPGHGGILDRVDAFLFVIPAAWVLYQTIGFLG